MMWTYRVCRDNEPNGEEFLSIRECYAREDAVPPYNDEDYTSWTAEPVAVVGSNFAELEWQLKMMAIALEKGVLDISTRKKSNPPV